MFAKKSAFSVLSALLVVLLLSTSVSASPLNVAVGKQSVSSPQYSLKSSSLSAPEPYSHGNLLSSLSLLPCTPPPSGMVSWWGGDNNALDMVGTNHGTLMGNATYAPGMVGQAFSFDGAEQSFVEIPNSAGLNPTGAFSVDGWFYIDPGAVGNDGEIATLVAKSQGSLNNGWSLYFDDRTSPNSLKFVLSTIVLAENAIPTANWYHIAGVYNPSITPQASLYVNGVKVADSGSGPETVAANELNLRIGAMHWTDVYDEGNDRFNGKADEVEFFNRALSADEIVAIYNAGNGGKCRSCTPAPANIVSWWNAEGNANDFIGTNHGTLMGNVSYAPGMVGQAFSFDGAEQNFVEIPDNAGLNPSGAFSVDGWFYLDPDANKKTISCLVSKWDAGYASGWGLDLSQSDLRMSVRSSAGVHAGASLSGAVPLAAWYHVAGVFDPLTTPRVKLYVNGLHVASSSVIVNDVGSNSFDVRIGACYWTETYGDGNDRLNGKADEVEFFNRALSAEEIAAVYNAGSAGKCRSCAPVPANIVSWWTANNNTNDFIGTNPGTLINGATFGPGKVGQAFSLDGGNDYVQVPDALNLSFSPTSPLTIYMWAYPTTVTPAMHLLGKRSTCYDSGQSANYQIAHDSSSGIAFNSGGTQLSSGYKLLPNQWQHIAVTADGSTFRIYVDGQEKASGAGTLGGQNIAPLDIGGVCSSDAGVKFPGLLDEVTIVSRALSATEIAAIYNAGSAGCCGPDYVPPAVVSIVRVDPNPTNAASVDFTVTFSEGVNGVDSADFALTNTGTITGQSIGIVAGGPTIYSVTVNTGSGDGTLRLDVNASSTGVQDLAGNPLSGAYTSGEAYDIDNVAPSVTMSSAASDPTKNSPIAVTAQFTETVTGFTVDDIVTNNGTVSNFLAVDGASYTFDLTPSAQGSVAADIAAGVASDLVGNANTAATQFSRVYDNVAPTVTMTSLAPDPTNATSISVTVQFSETVTGFAYGGIVQSNGTVSNFVAVDGDTYTFDLTPSAQGPVTADIAAGVATDSAGNANTAAAQFSRVYDNIAPSVTINSTASDPTKNSPIAVTAQFSETVTDFAVDDIETSNGTVSNFVAVDGDTYTFELTPSAQGSVTADIAAEVATDLAGNTNTAATQFSRVYDNIAPSVTMSSAVPNPTDALPIPVTVQFSKTVTGFTADDILTSNGAVSNFVAVDGDTFTFELIPSAKGSVTADIAAGVASDSVGNGNTAAAQFSRTYAPLEKLFLPLILR